MKKLILLVLIFTGIAFGYFEQNDGIPGVFSEDGTEAWILLMGTDSLSRILGPDDGIYFDDVFSNIIVGRIDSRLSYDRQTSLGWDAGGLNTAASATMIGVSCGNLNVGGSLTAIGNASAINNEGDDCTALGALSGFPFTVDTGNAKDITSVDFANNRVTITGGHGFGANGAFRNLRITTSDTLPAGLFVGIDKWEIISSTVLECLSDSFTDAGTGTHTLTPSFVFDNWTAVGSLAQPDASNQVMLGDTNVTEVKTSGSLTAAGATFSGTVVAATFNATDEVNALQIDGTTQFATKSPTDVDGIENLFIGASAGVANTTGDTNVFIGDGAGEANTTGLENIFIGFEAGGKQVAAEGNIFIGKFAGRGGAATVPTGDNNFGLGTTSCGWNSLTTGENNVCIGKSAGSSLTSGRFNMLIGFNAGGNLTTENENVLIGTGSGNTGTINVMIGASVAINNTSDRNTLVGYKVSNKQTSGQRNTVFGWEAAFYNITGSNNTAVGYECLLGVLTNSFSTNTAIGYQAGKNITTGGSNVFVGAHAGHNQTTNSSLFIVDNQDRSSAAAEITDSLIYGIFSATPASQSLRFNVGTTTWHNATHEDGDGGRLNQLNFKGQQSGGEETTLARIEVSHDGTDDDEKGKIVFSTNAGSDTNTPTLAVTIDSNQDVVMHGNAITDLGELAFNSATTLTISSGVVTVTQSHHSIDTEASADNDDLDTISGGNSGEILLILPANDDRTVRIRHGIGNIYLKHQTTEQSYNFNSPSGSGGTFYKAGYYLFPSTDSNLDQAGTTQALGASNGSYAAHASLIASGAGTASGGSGAVTIVVSGTSIDDEGNRDAGGTEVIVADITAMVTDQYFETTLKWLGTVTYTLTVGATGHSAFAADFNYGFSKYEDLGNTNFSITLLECVGRAGANDTGFNIRLFHHNATDWTYAASGFVPGPTAGDAAELANMNTTHGVEQDLVNNEPFAFKLTNLNQDINGDNGEGLVIEITTTAGKAVETMDIHIGVHSAPKFSYMATNKQHLIFMKHGPNWLEL